LQRRTCHLSVSISVALLLLLPLLLLLLLRAAASHSLAIWCCCCCSETCIPSRPREVVAGGVSWRCRAVGACAAAAGVHCAAAAVPGCQSSQKVLWLLTCTPSHMPVQQKQEQQQQKWQ
jgi:hypothetical protein